MASARLSLIFCIPALATSLCRADALFFVDTPQLLRAAETSVLAKFPDIPEGGLAAAPEPFRFTCRPDSRRYLHTEAATQCLANPYAAAPCSARVRLMPLSSAEQQVTALENGRCHFKLTYNPIIVDFYHDGAMDIRRHDFEFESAHTETCDYDQSPRSVNTIAEQHEARLIEEFSTVDGFDKNAGIIHAGGYFQVDFESLMVQAQESIHRAHPDTVTQKLYLKDSDFSIFCGEKEYWKFVDMVSLEIPKQKVNTKHCSTRLSFVLGQGTVEELGTEEGGKALCRFTAPEEQYSVRIFSDGSAKVDNYRSTSHYEGACTELKKTPSVAEAVSRYKSVLAGN